MKEKSLKIFILPVLFFMALICLISGCGHLKKDSVRMLRVLLNGEVIQMDMATYLYGVLCEEVPATYDMEALKAQAVAARTYTINKIKNGPSSVHPDADVCGDFTCCQAYKSPDEMKQEWGDLASEYEEKLTRAIFETDNEIILYKDKPILAVFCNSTIGHTQNAAAVWKNDLPYLQSVDSPEDNTNVPDYYSEVLYTAAEFRELFLSTHPEADLSGKVSGWIKNIERNDSGYVAFVDVGGVLLKGNELRTILKLRSPAFTVETTINTLTFHVTAYGHGVGMSQCGANVLALSGKDYKEILAHYYVGTTLGHYEG